MLSSLWLKKCTFKLQWCALENQQSTFYVVNEVTLTGQNPSLKFCQSLDILTQFEKGFALLMLKIQVCRSKDCKVFGHETFRIIWPQAYSNLGQRCLHTLQPLKLISLQEQSLMASNFATLESVDTGWVRIFRETEIGFIFREFTK